LNSSNTRNHAPLRRGHKSILAAQGDTPGLKVGVQWITRLQLTADGHRARSRRRYFENRKMPEPFGRSSFTPNFCCNFVNENKSEQNAANDNQRRKLSSSRKRTDLAESEDDAEAGMRDLKSTSPYFPLFC
jgi:hypothetical protein